jgi:succinate-semialdehyde dehydrogenase/glutarate-semialdehyde dehydrogenase
VLLAEAAKTVVNCSMELGGNAPFIVCADADVDAAVDGAMIAKMRNGGEACTAANRFYVHDAVMDEFANKFAARMRGLKVGPGLDPGVELGPLINQQARTDVHGLVTDSVDKGAATLAGGCQLGDKGYFYAATVLADVPQSARMLQEEIFGPVAPLVRFSDDDQAIALANDSEYGLIAYLYTENLRKGLAMAEQLDAGMIGLNRGLVSDPAAPFGGTKQSGIGREGAHDGLMEFLEKKYIAVSW